MKITNILTITVLALAVFMLGAFMVKNDTPINFGGGDYNRIQTLDTVETQWISSTGTNSIIANSAISQYAEICNSPIGADMYLTVATSSDPCRATTTDNVFTGRILEKGECYPINGDNLFVPEICGVVQDTSLTSTTITVMEK